MIITMRRDADFFTIKSVVDALVRMGWDVQIRNGKNEEQAVLAALGNATNTSIHLRVEQLPGVDGYEKGNDLFIDTNGKDFLEAWEWERSKRVEAYS
ncbi:MAG: hypothetical protein ABIJ84_00595 [bacterium]